MASKGNRNGHSMETILTFDRNDQSQWSVQWSTEHIPGMDNAMGGVPRRREVGRRRLRLGALALGSCLTIHCRVAASALTGGFFVFILFLVISVALLANPLRHFEVYLGQWSISGPGRAFRIVPMIDGIGIAICINSIIRAINCCTIAAMAALYVVHSVADSKLPYTYCRDWNLKAYDPIVKGVRHIFLREARYPIALQLHDENESIRTTSSITVGMNELAWRNASRQRLPLNERHQYGVKSHRIEVCNEKYSDETYPILYSTPAYNFFYVEVARLRSDYNKIEFNLPLLLGIISVWMFIWGLMLLEKVSHGRLIWNNVYTWIVAVPWIWVTLLIIAGVYQISHEPNAIGQLLRFGATEVITGIADALEIALYFHSASTGTELIHGKGLNHYASGHIDPKLNSENIWHSCLLLLPAALHSTGTASCAIADIAQSTMSHDLRESTLWIIPMYSKCSLVGNYSHTVSTLLFGGLMFSYITVAFILIKTALHTIFEYRVKLVFVEQYIVGALILSCIGLSLPYATTGGLPLLESVDALMSGVAMPLVCLLELVGLIYVYRCHDFMSDMNVATEDNACSSRIDTQWQIIPFIAVGLLIVKIVSLVNSELPPRSMCIGIAPLLGVALATPLRACHNAYVFLKPSPRRGV